MPRDPAGARLRKKRRNREKLARLADQRLRAAEAAASRPAPAGETPGGDGVPPEGPTETPPADSEAT